MQRHIKLEAINSYLLCTLCGGYLIDATTLVECLHSFCRGCLLKYIKQENYNCPKCNLEIHKTKPLEYIRSDPCLQEIVYKLVPDLFSKEESRRHSWKREHNDDIAAPPVTRDEPLDDSRILVTLKYFRGTSRMERIKTEKVLQMFPTRYLCCNPEMPVGVLKKFVCLKFDICHDIFNVELWRGDETLLDELTLKELVQIYGLYRERKPLDLHFSLYPKIDTIAIQKETSEKPYHKGTENKIPEEESMASIEKDIGEGTLTPSGNKEVTYSADESVCSQEVMDTSQLKDTSKILVNTNKITVKDSAEEPHLPQSLILKEELKKLTSLTKTLNTTDSDSSQKSNVSSLDVNILGDDDFKPEALQNEFLHLFDSDSQPNSDFDTSCFDNSSNLVVDDSSKNNFDNNDICSLFNTQESGDSPPFSRLKDGDELLMDDKVKLQDPALKVGYKEGVIDKVLDNDRNGIPEVTSPVKMDFEDNLKPFESNLKPFESNLKPFESNLKPFEGNLKPFEGNLIKPFEGNLKPLEESCVDKREENGNLFIPKPVPSLLPIKDHLPKAPPISEAPLKLPSLTSKVSDIFGEKLSKELLMHEQAVHEIVSPTRPFENLSATSLMSGSPISNDEKPMIADFNDSTTTADTFISNPSDITMEDEEEESSVIEPSKFDTKLISNNLPVSAAKSFIADPPFTLNNSSSEGGRLTPLLSPNPTTTNISVSMKTGSNTSVSMKSTNGDTNIKPFGLLENNQKLVNLKENVESMDTSEILPNPATPTDFKSATPTDFKSATPTNFKSANVFKDTENVITEQQDNASEKPNNSFLIKEDSNSTSSKDLPTKQDKVLCDELNTSFESDVILKLLTDSPNNSDVNSSAEKDIRDISHSLEKDIFDLACEERLDTSTNFIESLSSKTHDTSCSTPITSKSPITSTPPTTLLELPEPTTTTMEKFADEFETEGTPDPVLSFLENSNDEKEKVQQANNVTRNTGVLNQNYSTSNKPTSEFSNLFVHNVRGVNVLLEDVAATMRSSEKIAPFTNSNSSDSHKGETPVETRSDANQVKNVLGGLSDVEGTDP